MPFWVGDGALGLLPNEPDSCDTEVLVGVVELRKGAVELLDVSVPFPPGCWAVALVDGFIMRGGI